MGTQNRLHTVISEEGDNEDKDSKMEEWRGVCSVRHGQAQTLHSVQHLCS